MGNLFLVSRSPFLRKESLLAICLAGREDAVCLIQDGVYLSHTVPDDFSKEVIKARSIGVKFYVLVEDCEARAVNPDPGYLPVDYAGLAGLIINYKRIIS